MNLRGYGHVFFEVYAEGMLTSLVHWRDVVVSKKYTKEKAPLAVPMGKTAGGTDVIVDLHALRHLLFCGIADSGKTTLVHSILNALIAKNNPDTVKFFIVDPKKVEFQSYNELSHLLTPVITDAKKALLALKWVNKEADRRLSVLQTHKVRSIEEYHAKVLKKNRGKTKNVHPEAMPYIVTVIDDLSLLMPVYPREFNAAISSLIPNAKATGIHLIVTTSRFDSSIMPVALREHFLARVAFHMPAVQSRLIVGDSSAEALTERGAAIFRQSGMHQSIALKCALISEDEIDAHTETMTRKYPKEELSTGLVASEEYWGKKTVSLITGEDDVEDDMYAQAVEVAREAGKVSTAFLQRRLGIGYSRAARLIDILEERGIIGPGNGAAPRDVIDEDE